MWHHIDNDTSESRHKIKRHPHKTRGVKNNPEKLKKLKQNDKKAEFFKGD